MNNLYEALEICLQEMEQGADIDTVLFRYPDLAEELRPILEASIGARSLAVQAPSDDVVRRNRARVLQHAAQLRESQSRHSLPRLVWFASLRRVAVTLVMIAALFVSGTNLVSAASSTLPGDNLYPVKRTWEDVLLVFTFNMQQRAALETEHENERLHELRELFAQGRPAEVDFAGLVTSQNGNEWIVSGVRVIVSPETEVRDGPVLAGSAVRVRGETQGDGVVRAERVRVLPPDANLPDVEIEDEDESGADDSTEVENQNNDNSGKGSDEQEDDNMDNSGSGSGSEDDSQDSGSDTDDNSGSGSGSDPANNDDSNSPDNSNVDSDNSGSGGSSQDDSKNDTDKQADDNSGSGGGGNDSDNNDG